jgi:hypothetical protein
MITTTVAEDLSSVSVSEDGALECVLPNYNPETMTPFTSEAEVIAYAASIEGREYFWIPKLSDEEKAATAFNEAADKVRTKRNALLSETDWRFRSDLTPSQEWKDYCQALRDITAQEGFPWTITWPDVPTGTDAP